MLALPLDEWSVKVSDAPPDDAAEDLDAPVWAGVVPLREVCGEPVAAPDLRRASRRCPAYVGAWSRTRVNAGYRALSFWHDTLPGDRWAPRRRCPATATSTSRSSAPATPGCGRPTTSRAARPDAAGRRGRAEIAGFGASGRNGGWCSALFPASMGRSRRGYGRDGGARHAAAR